MTVKLVRHAHARTGSGLSYQKAHCHDQNKWQKLFDAPTPREESTPKKDQKTNRDHVMFVHTVRRHIHVIERVGHVRMTIIPAEIVTALAVFRVGLVPNGGVPLLSRNTTTASAATTGGDG